MKAIKGIFNVVVFFVYLLAIQAGVDFFFPPEVLEEGLSLAIGPAAIPIAMGAAKGIMGASQMIKASKINAVRPEMQVQDEYGQNVSMMENALYGNTPEDQYASDAIRQSTANVVQQASKYSRSGSDVLSMLGSANQQELSALRGEASARSQRRVGLMNALSRAKESLASEKQKAWDYNLRQKYEEDAAAKAALNEAGIKNIQAGVSDIAGGAMKGGGGGKTPGGIVSGGADGASPGAQNANQGVLNYAPNAV